MNQVSDFTAALARALPESAFRLSADDRRPFEADWRGLFNNASAAILLPGSTDETARMLELCNEHGIAVVPQGGNTGLVGGAVPIENSGAQAILSLRRMRAIRTVDPLNNTMEIEAGVILQAAQQAAEAADRLLPLSLAAEGSCQIGGTIATNAGGIQVLAYGSMRNLVLGLEVVLPDGQVWNGLRSLRKDNTGIDLKQIFIGSEGILGVITAATLRLVPRPRKSLTALAAISDPRQGLSLLRAAQENFGSELTSCEYFGAAGLELVSRHLPGAVSPFANSHPAFVLLEVSSLDAHADLAARIEPVFERLVTDGTLQDVVIAQNEAQRQRLWALREALSEGERAAGGAIKHDIAVPIFAIPDVLHSIESGLPGIAPGARPNVFGHLGDGNLHVNIMPPEGRAIDLLLARATEITSFIEGVVVAAGGTFSAEHGIGQLRLKSLKQHRSPLELELMRAIKGVLDPKWMMNPGKVLNQGS